LSEHILNRNLEKIRNNSLMTLAYNVDMVPKQNYFPTAR